MAPDPAEELALWRYHLIAEALDRRLGTRERGLIVRRLAGEEHVGPDGQPRLVSTACGCQVPLTAFELTCQCFDPRTRILVAWICADCDIVVELVGLFISWSDAISAGQHALDDRYLGGVSNIGTTHSRRNVTTESHTATTPNNTAANTTAGGR